MALCVALQSASRSKCVRTHLAVDVASIADRGERALIWVNGRGCSVTSASTPAPAAAPRRSHQRSFGKQPHHVPPPHPVPVRPPYTATCTLEQRPGHALAVPVMTPRSAAPGHSPVRPPCAPISPPRHSPAGRLGRCSTCRRPRPLAPVRSKLRRSAIQSQAASMRKSARSSPRGI